MGLDFRKIDSNENGYLDADDTAGFASAINELMAVYSLNPNRIKDHITSEERGKSLEKLHQDHPELPYDSEKARYIDDYALYFWKQLGGTMTSHNYGAGAAIANFTLPAKSLKDLVDNPVSWIDISDADKKLVRNGTWDELDNADTDHDGFIEQKNDNGDNELETHIINFLHKNFVGPISSDDIFSPTKQKEYKEKYGLYRVNTVNGEWAPTENLEIKDFANLSFRSFSFLNASWNARRFIGWGA